MATPTETVESLLRAWKAMDVDAIVEHFSEDAVYHNVPMDAVRGIGPIRSLVKKLIAPMDGIEFKVLHTVESGTIVMNERVDTMVIRGKTVAVPTMGIFEVRGGKIAAWRDYFDLETLEDQMN